MSETHDIERLILSAAQYENPTEEELAAAPILEEWCLLEDVEDDDDLPAVCGIIYGHPLVADGSVHIGAEAFAMSPDMKWIFTLSRLYRLGSRK